MIRHIVLWKLAATDAAARDADILAIQQALLPMLDHVEGLRALDVKPNVAYPEGNWDLALVGDFDSLAALEEYQVHPEHLKAIDVVRPRAASRSAVDYEL